MPSGNMVFFRLPDFETQNLIVAQTPARGEGTEFAEFSISGVRDIF